MERIVKKIKAVFIDWENQPEIVLDETEKTIYVTFPENEEVSISTIHLMLAKSGYGFMYSATTVAASNNQLTIQIDY